MDDKHKRGLLYIILGILVGILIGRNFANNDTVTLVVVVILGIVGVFTHIKHRKK